ncbi:phosphodiester glycosidase family protein [Paenibacillus chartarius]|uniref:Phosphodiester glycosidase family protein n=1 Tax=Paenibacillus chartarius TaxID=747481 RepID=A0ABV6DJ38_9BACL
MNTAFQWISATTNHVRGWSWIKRLLTFIALLAFLASTFLFYTPLGTQIRIFLAETVITTQHREWAWIFVGAEKRDEMVRKLQGQSDEHAKEKQDLSAVKFDKDRPIDELVKVKDVSGEFWKGKMMYVYDPRSIRVVVPDKVGEGERITSMVNRTGAVAGVNGGGFVDPEGLGNGFAPIGPIISGGELLYIDQDGNVPQHIVGFTKEGTLVIGKYTYPELQKMGISEAVMFYPRVIANGKPLITSGDGGWGRGPRTAVGQRADGTVIFVVVDGRQAHSVGATLREIQDLLLAEGAINAGFLDGGASSELVYNGELVSKPSSRYGERRLPSAFLVFDHPETVKNKRIWDGLDKIDAGGSYDHPDYQAELKANQQKKTTTTPSSTKKETEEPTGTGSGKGTGTGSGTGSGSTSGAGTGTGTNGTNNSTNAGGKSSTTTKSGDSTTQSTDKDSTKSTTGTQKEGTTGTGTSGTGTSAGTDSGGDSATPDKTAPGSKTGTGAGTSTGASSGSGTTSDKTGTGTPAAGSGAAVPNTDKAGTSTGTGAGASGGAGTSTGTGTGVNTGSVSGNGTSTGGKTTTTSPQAESGSNPTPSATGEPAGTTTKP